MTDIKAEIKGLQETQREMERIVRELHGGAILNGMRTATLIVQRAAKVKVPVDTGRLKASITPEVKPAGTQVLGVVGTVVKYGPYVELGTRPHFVSAKNIGVWAKRHGFGYTGLRVSGKARPYLYPAVKENAERIFKTLDNAVARAISGG